MIITTVTGGLGNQMFQYAYAHMLAKKLGDRIVLNNSQMGKQELEIRKVSLQHLNLDIDVGNRLKCQKIIDFLFQIYRKIGIRCLKMRGLDDTSIFEKMAKHGIYYCPDVFGDYPFIYTSKKVKYVEGAFQSYQYIEKCPELKELLQVKTAPDLKNTEMLEKISASDSVCLHIRRGDYSAFPSLQVCTEEYYKSAISKMRKMVPNAVFYIFSNTHDDLEWIKNNYNLGEECNIVYVDMGNPDYEELRLMYTCKHFIISNSTFSWWAQFLGKYENKIVMAPEIWHKGRNNSENIYMPNWITISVGEEKK